MTADEFVAAYAARSNVSVERLKELGYKAYPCDCDYPGCEGWKLLRDVLRNGEKPR